MKRLSVGLLLFLAGYWALGADGPRIQFASRVHDFGRIDSGQVAKADFVFTNTGNATLEIVSVKPGCGCTTAGTWDRKVEPGKTGTIPLQFNSTGFQGNVTKSATVTCNDSTESNITLQLKANIWKPIEVDPASAYFSLTEEGAPPEPRTIRIVNNLDKPLTVTEPVWTNTAFKVEFSTVKPGKEYALKVTPQPPFPSAFAQGNYVLKTSAEKFPTIGIPLYANIQPSVGIYPGHLLLPTGGKDPFQPNLTIRNSGTNNLVLSDPAVNVPGAEVSLKELQPGRVFSLTAKFPAGTTLSATEKSEITVKSNHPKYPVLRVPVLQSQPRPARSVTLPTK